MQISVYRIVWDSYSGYLGGGGMTPVVIQKLFALLLPCLYSGSRCVVTTLCFVWFCFYAFKARRRRNAAKSAYYCFRIHKVFLTLSAHNRSIARQYQRQSAKPRRYQAHYPSRFPPSLVGTTPIDYVLIPRGITTPKLNGRVMVKVH